jgi:subtilisin family serine protease
MTTRPLRSLRPVLAGTLLTALALSTSVTTGSPAHSQPRSTPDGATPDQGAPPATGESNQVTLVTGERLVLTTLPSGEQSLTAAASADGTMPTLHAEKLNGGDVYVWPADLGILVDTFFDRELFNVSKLVRQGLADEASSSIPLIVDYRGSIAARPIPGDVQRELTLASIGAVAGDEPKASANELGDTVRAELADDGAVTGRDVRQLTRTGPFAGIERIYLDEQIHAALADSVPQIGAPEAWEAGFDGTGVDVAVLDSGIDSTHPDLQGKVVAEANFTTRPTATDENGHGTHVASTVAGSGAASGGSRRGVAPGATLLNGRVLDQNGSGEVSWAIAAMDWAADNGAEVISFSLQAGFSDGSDPFSQAVNQLTLDRGILFSIAAGNFGSGAQTVTVPGTADLALTVGAVTKQDELAGFSGRGPRQGNFSIKPDITAPGVGIVAARAAGTSLGTPVDDFYTTLDGTSMATPHVSGAAAILKQEFPDFTPAQLKAALVSTAAPGPFTVYEQGGGRVDVARAFSQHVYADSAPIDFGYFPHPHDADQPVTKQLSWSNYTDAPVTLDLTVDVTGENGTAPAEGMITLSASSVTIPAGGSAAVDMTVDTRLGDPSLYGGVVRAQSADGSVVVRTPVGFYKESVRFNLTLDGIARDGRPARGISWVEVVNVDDTRLFQQTVGLTDGPATLRVPPGTYSLMGMIFTYDEPHVFATELAIAGDPEIEIDQDTTYVVDARPATEIVPVTDEPTEARFWVSGTYRAAETFGSFEGLLLSSSPIDRVFAAPTEQVTKGDFGFRAKPNLHAPEIELSITRPRRTDLDVTYATGSPRIDGRKKLDLVYAGYGRVEDFEGLDVRGKAVLMTRGPLPPVGDPITFQEKVDNATAVGAAAAIIHNHSPGVLLVSLASAEIPVFTQPQAQGEEVRALLQQGKRVRLTANGIPQSPYLYDVVFAERGRIQDTHFRILDEETTARIDATYRSQVDRWVAGDVRHAFPPWSNFSFDGARNFAVPFTREEHIAAGDGNRWFHVGYGSMEPFPEFVFQWEQQGLRDVLYDPGARASETWFGQPQHPNVIRTYTGPDIGDPVLREGNTLRGFVPATVDPVGRWGIQDSRTDNAPFRLFENGRLIAEGEGFWNFYSLGDQPATYRAELEVTRTAPFWTLSTHTETTWTFASAPPPGGGAEVVPLLVVDFDLGQLDVQNRSRRARQHIELHAHRQPGAPTATISSFALWVSYDDGASWDNVRTDPVGDGHYRAAIKNPTAAEHVSLRVEARDSGGSRIDQTIIRAYGLD